MIFSFLLKTGNLIALEYEDILSLWKLQKDSKSKLDYTFNNFKFFKEVDFINNLFQTIPMYI